MIKTNQNFRKSSYITSIKNTGCFTISANGRSSQLCISSNDYPGVRRVINHLKSDILNVTNNYSEIFLDKLPQSKEIIIIGTLGKNEFIDRLVNEKKIDVADIKDKWETFLIQVVENPFPDIDRALVITGSDKRGTIFGIYDLSSQIGVSPWYWWADVPIKKQPDIFVIPCRYTIGEPAVKYRGIFINDEAPALSGWVYEKYGGLNHEFYEKVFELILRMKGNYLWPAMWGNSIYDDDPETTVLADEFGVVLGTSHHEPMARAQREWKRYGTGVWNYDKNEAVLREFWKQGIRQMGSKENIVTVGMRGDGDEPMAEGSNISLLERIIADQRSIIKEVTGKDPEAIPQLWAIYKEVQDYYDRGMKVPDDITLLLCDDNWGNIRRLPKPDQKKRSGGYGIYYHYDYVGGPRNYKWLNTTQISRVLEQMQLAYEHGVDRIWIVNAGDIKPLEFPIEFFLDYAWFADRWDHGILKDYTEFWAKQQFGEKHSETIAHLINTYTKFNSRRKPELLSRNIYSVVNYREADTYIDEYNALAHDAENILKELPDPCHDAFHQLVLFPIKACANLNQMYLMLAKNYYYASQGRSSTNKTAESVEILFNKDAELRHHYNKFMSNGKWNHMMDQTHISYTYWQQPEKDVLPEVKKIILPGRSEMGVMAEGSENFFPDKKELTLPEFDPFNKNSFFIEVFNRGSVPFEYSIKSDEKWIKITGFTGKVDIEEKIFIDVDWKMAPNGNHSVPVTIFGPDDKVVAVFITLNNAIGLYDISGFVESNGYVSIEAEHYLNAVNSNGITWKCIPHLGRTLSSITPYPVTAQSIVPGGNSPHLEYRMFLTSIGEVKVNVYVAPMLNIFKTDGIKFAVSFDDENPQIINLHEDKTSKTWEQWVSDNIVIKESKHKINKDGIHMLKFWMVDPGIVLQKIVVDTGKLKPSYLGPPESFYK